AYYAYPKFGQYTAVLRVTDNNVPAKTDIASMTIDVKDGNLAPVANANGPYWINIGEGVILDGRGSTNPDKPAWGDQIVKYAWDLNRDGVDDAFGAEVAVTWNQLIALGLGAAGAYTVELEVTDTLGAKGLGTAQLRVFENMPTAVATATPNPTAPGQAIAFNASASSHDRPDRSIVQYEWDFHYDGSFSAEATSATPTASFTYNAFGVYNVMLRVTDNNSPAKRDFLDTPLVITVNQGNQAPTAEANGPYVIETGTGLVLDGTGSFDPNTAFGDQIVSYQWSINGNLLPNNTASVSLTWGQLAALGLPLATELPVTLTVVDKLGASGTDTTTLAIYENRPFAVFTALPNPVACQTPVAFDAGGSYHGWPAYGIAKYEWDFNYDGTTFTVDSTGVTATHSYSKFGSYLAALRVTDNSPAQKTDLAVATIDVSLGNRAPTADAGGPYVFGVSSPIVLDGRGSFDQDALDGFGDSIVAYAWDLDGDGQYDDATGAQPTIPAGTLGLPVDSPVTIGLRVTDQFGAIGTDTATLSITTNQPPAADAGGPYTVNEGSPLVLDGTGSTDDQPGLTYEWDVDYDGVTFQVDATGAQPVVTFGDNAASQTIALRVTDSVGMKDLATTTVTINNVNPVAGALQVSPSVTLDGQVLIGTGAVILTGSFSDAGALDTHTVSIAWGDGVVSAAAVNQAARTFQASHLYSGGGQPTILATVTDDDGGAGTVSKTVKIANDLGVVDFRSLVDQDPAAGDLWYRLEAAHGGLLTVEFGGSGAAAAAVKLFDAAQNTVAALANGPSTGGVDFLVAAGGTYYLKLSGTTADVDLRLTNLVEQTGAAVTVHGTSGDDAFEFELAASHYVRINGTEYHFADVAGAVDTVDFDGGLGSDTATFLGDAAFQSARFVTGRGEFYSAVLKDGVPVFDNIGFFVDALAENLIAHSGGGEDWAQMYDSPGDDVFTVSPRLATLTGPGYSHAANGFYVNLGYATNRSGDGKTGGNDQAFMNDSANDDKFKLDWTKAGDFF
ncbi:MAG: PKD domain-containing protein, partial [Phycisphaerales bacterium]